MPLNAYIIPGHRVRLVADALTAHAAQLRRETRQRSNAGADLARYRAYLRQRADLAEQEAAQMLARAGL